MKNHKGRFCQELTPDDLEILGETLSLVDYTETVTFIVHNNTCVGDTGVALVNDIGGTLAGVGLSADGRMIRHYHPIKLAAFSCRTNPATAGVLIWDGDRQMTYTAPRCSFFGSTQAKDTYSFSADGPVRNVIFQLRDDFLYQFANGLTFSLANAGKHGFHLATPDRCTAGPHIHGLHPCTGAPDPDPGGCGHGVVTKVKP